MKALLTVTAIIECVGGVALLCFPSLAAKLLFGAPLEVPAALAVARYGGVGLLTLGVACGFAQFDAQSCAARGLTGAMVLFNLGAVTLLGVAGLQLNPAGVALWPAVLLHAGMTGWCVACLLRKPAASAT
jgi:hypothetical protein